MFDPSEINISQVPLGTLNQVMSRKAPLGYLLSNPHFALHGNHSATTPPLVLLLLPRLGGHMWV